MSFFKLQYKEWLLQQWCDHCKYLWVLLTALLLATGSLGPSPHPFGLCLAALAQAHFAVGDLPACPRQALALLPVAALLLAHWPALVTSRHESAFTCCLSANEPHHAVLHVHLASSMQS